MLPVMPCIVAYSLRVFLTFLLSCSHGVIDEVIKFDLIIDYAIYFTF